MQVRIEREEKRECTQCDVREGEKKRKREVEGENIVHDVKERIEREE